MSSPYSRETQKGTEESIEAIDHATQWLSRISSNDISGKVDPSVSEMSTELLNAKEELISDYTDHTIETAIDNFVNNQQETVIQMLTGDIDTKVSAIREAQEYIGNNFGYVRMPSFSKENILWLTAQEVLDEKESQYGPEEYNSLDKTDLESLGTKPDSF
jgi:hypothetical protein